jgi:hydroxyethylthiazole kinase-like uncharacterized protein yjeF
VSPIPIAPSDLHRFPLPRLTHDGDKEDRGEVLVVAGGSGVPGAALLTGLAALRAGAGKLQLAAPLALRVPLGVAAPEAAIVPVPADPQGEIAAHAAEALQDRAALARAVVIGPGMLDEAAAAAVACGLIARAEMAAFVLDAGALPRLAAHAQMTRTLAGRLVITPHAGEMAKLCGCERQAIQDDPLAAALRVSRELGAVVALKGVDTYIATPRGEAFLHAGGAVGLATSGSGDVLAGIVGGLLARGADALTATLWGVCIHGAAGGRLTREVGAVGFLARELLEVIAPMIDATPGAAG